MRHVRWALATALVAGLAVTGVPLAFGGEGELQVGLTEFRVDAPAEYRAGETPLLIRNSGRVTHDLIVVRTNRPPGKLPVGLNGVAPQLAGKVVYGEPYATHEHGVKGPGTLRHIGAGRSKQATLKLRPGRYVLLCSLPGHYQQGQRAVLTVR